VVGMMPWLPTPTGMWSNSDCSQAGRKADMDHVAQWRANLAAIFARNLGLIFVTCCICSCGAHVLAAP
jgi:hypothetical protein